MNAIRRTLAASLMLLLAATPAVSYTLACIVDGRAQPFLVSADDCHSMAMQAPEQASAPAEHGPQPAEHEGQGAPQESAHCCAVLALSPPPAAVSPSDRSASSWKLPDEADQEPRVAAAPPAPLSTAPPGRILRPAVEVRPAFARAGTRTYLATARLRL